VDADLTHPAARGHRTAFANLIDRPLAYLSSGQFAANTACAI